MKNNPSFRHHFDTLSDNELDDLAEIHEDYPITTSDHDNMVNTKLIQELGYEPYLDTVKNLRRTQNES